MPLIIEQARKNSVAVQRFRITKAQAEEIRKIEQRQGHDTAVRRLLELPGNIGMTVSAKR